MPNTIDTNEESIDLGRLAHVAFDHKKAIGAIIGACTVVAIGVAMYLPKQYESTTVVQMSNATAQISSSAAALSALTGGGGASSPSTTYMELMKTRAVLDPIIDDMPWWSERPDGTLAKPDAKGFAKQFLTIENTKGTSLIEVKALGYTPEEAQYISQSVVDNFLVLQTEKNVQTQSALLKFLNERIEDAKQEADEACEKFAQYQKAHKVYSPADQAKSIVSQTEAWDKAIGDVEVQRQAAQAQLDAVQSQIGDQESRSEAYQVNDNSAVQSLRSQIVAKQVELVSLRQKYTDNHPAVKAAENELAELQRSLSHEVDTIVNSHTTTLNSTHAGLLKQKIEGEVNLATSQASEEALKKRRDEKEKELGDFPDDVLQYMRLEQDSKLKNGIYAGLVQQSENARMKQAMESMDIQVIDEANLPREDAPAKPNKRLIAAIGFALGCLLSFGYTLIAYKRENA